MGSCIAYRNRKIKKKCVRILALLDKVSDFPSDEEYDTVNSRQIKQFKLSVTKKRVEKICTSKKTNMLERIPPPFRLYDHSNPIDLYGDAEFARRYIFDKKTTLNILSMIEYGLLKPSNRGHPVTPLMQLLVTLRFLSTGKRSN